MSDTGWIFPGTAAQAVRAAAAHLDQVKPDWWRNVDPIRLNLADHVDCPCGQNGLAWSEVAAAEGYSLEFIEVTSIREYEPLWLAEIAFRAKLCGAFSCRVGSTPEFPSLVCTLPLHHEGMHHQEGVSASWARAWESLTPA